MITGVGVVSGSVTAGAVVGENSEQKETSNTGSSVIKFL